MINILMLKPSQWEKLSCELIDSATQERFLDGLRGYLSSSTCDDGVDVDRIYVTAVNTENAGVWQHIGAERLLDVLKSVDQQIARIFLSGLPRALADKVLSQLG